MLTKATPNTFRYRAARSRSRVQSSRWIFSTRLSFLFLKSKSTLVRWRSLLVRNTMEILWILVLTKVVFAVGTAEMEGPSVTLHTAVGENARINWLFGPQEWPIAHCTVNENLQCEITLQTGEQNNTFRDTLQIHYDGSLTIMNVSTEHAGVYTLQTIKSHKSDKMKFNVSVSAPETVSESHCSKCVQQCSVMNLTRVTLSCDIGSASPFLEVKYQDTSNSCVVNNSISEQTKQHCQHGSDSGLSPGHMALMIALLVALVALVALVVVAVAVFLYKKLKAGRNVFAHRYNNGTVSRIINDHSDERRSSRNNEEP